MRFLGLLTSLALAACATGATTPPPEAPAPPAEASGPTATAADTDRDGIPDGDDRCPRDAETLNGHRDTDGCPDIAPRAVAPGGPIQIIERVVFKHDSAEIQPTSFGLLDAIAMALKTRSEQFPTVALEGHAAGNERSPMKLSLARSSAVRLALLARGVDEGRLLARASGTMAPGCAEETETCRAHERSVEFVTLAGSRPPTVASPAEEPRAAAPDKPPEPKAPADSAAAAMPLERVEFKKGSALLGPASLPNLDLLAGFMKATPADLEIVGYADDNERKPDALAQARADAIRRYMLACGVSAQHLQTRTERTGRADCRSHSANCPARNGRAELHFVDQPAPPTAATPAEPAPPKTDGE